MTWCHSNVILLLHVSIMVTDAHVVLDSPPNATALALWNTSRMVQLFISYAMLEWPST